MLLEAIILGFAVFLSMFITASHLPQQVKQQIRKHPIATDIAATVFAYLSLTAISKTVVAAMGALFATLFVNIAQKIDEWFWR